MYTREDLDQLNKKGISVESIENQIKSFRDGFPFLKLQGSATKDNGIMVLSENEERPFLEIWNNYLMGNGKVVKFVPASGAASRMFKDLFEFLNSKSGLPESKFEKFFFENIRKFAFFDELDKVCVSLNGKDIVSLIKNGEHVEIVKNLLMPQGLNYGSLPKGLLKFHDYPDGPRKSVVEHLVEGALYAKSADDIVNVHFTVSPEHKTLFDDEINLSSPAIEKAYGVKLNVSFSVQKLSTDTVAADSENNPFRENGGLIFRPGGHGALIENLNDLDADVVFIKNIDNIVPDGLKDITVRYKKLIAGILIDLQKRAFTYLELLEKGNYNHDDLIKIIRFVQQSLCTRNPETKLLEDSDLVIYLRSRLNRPIRVCGMVKNQGEPGGGPFWAYNQDGTYSLQILESSQIDLEDPEKKVLFEQGTHFNPVDLVCSLKNFKGEKFNLPDYIDKRTGFISLKSKNGRELKALELPGLWNGAMSDWNTVFVEVPIATFNPVKTVNDLLRDEHQ